MPIVDIVKCETKDGIFCERFVKDDIRLGSQLVVYPSQVAFFVKGGAIYDQFTSGTYTLKSENIPLLNNVINIPFGKESPFKADVWFVSLISKLNMAWGTPNPIQIEDPQFHIIVPIRSYGQYGIKVVDPRKFLETLIGNMESFSASQIDQYFKGKLLSYLNNIIADQIITNKCSVLEINTKLIELSNNCEQQLNTQFSKYGLSIVEFSIMSINFPEEDTSVIKLKEAKDTVARINITGRDVYQMERGFDVLEKAAENGSGMAGVGAGLGTGIAVGSVVGNMAGQLININPTTDTPPPLPQKTYFIVVDGKQVGGQSIQQIIDIVQSGKANSSTLVWTKGMKDWDCLANIPELSAAISEDVPPPLPKNI